MHKDAMLKIKSFKELKPLSRDELKKLSVDWDYVIKTIATYMGQSELKLLNTRLVKSFFPEYGNSVCALGPSVVIGGKCYGLPTVCVYWYKEGYRTVIYNSTKFFLVNPTYGAIDTTLEISDKVVYLYKYSYRSAPYLYLDRESFL